MLPVAPEDVIPSAEPMPNVAPEAKVKVPKSLTTFDPVLSVPLMVPTNPEAIPTFRSSVIDALALMFHVSKVIEPDPAMVFPIPVNVYTCVPVLLVKVPLTVKSPAKVITPVCVVTIVTLVPTTKFPFTVRAPPPVGLAVQLPDVLSKLRLPYVLPDIETAGVKVELPL